MLGMYCCFLFASRTSTANTIDANIPHLLVALKPKSMNRFSLVVILAIAACMVVSSCKSAEPSTETTKVLHVDDAYAFDFVHSASLSPILDQAEQEGKLVFIDLYATWCLPCKMMDEDVFTHQATADMINDRFISYKVDVEKSNGPDLATIYNIRSYPTLLFVDSKGRVLERKEGAAYHKELLAMADRAWSKKPSQELGLGTR